MTGDRALSFILFASSLILAVMYTPVREEMRVVVAFVTSGRAGAQAVINDFKPAPDSSSAIAKSQRGANEAQSSDDAQ